MEILEISQGLIWAIIYKNPSNSFYVIATESQKNKRVTDRQQKCDFYKKVIIFRRQLKYLLLILN